MESNCPAVIAKISTPGEPRFDLAVRLALRYRPEEDRRASRRRLEASLVSGSQPGHDSPGPELFVARAGDRLAGAAWIEWQTGGAVVCSPPQLIDDDRSDTAIALLRAVADDARSRGAVLLEALLESTAAAEIVVFLDAGFEHACDLLYMVSSADGFPKGAESPAAELEFLTVRVEDDARLAAIVERTYQGTLDCPRLNHVRSASDVLRGYQEIGSFSRERWLIARHANRDIGCLLLADHPQTQQWELVYMGLEPAERGRGRGAELARHAQWLAGRAGRERLVLAVDAANLPALAMYQQAGLQAWDRRAVMLRVLTGARAAD